MRGFDGSIPVAMGDLIFGAMQKDLSKRIKSAKAMRGALHRKFIWVATDNGRNAACQSKLTPDIAPEPPHKPPLCLWNLVGLVGRRGWACAK